MTVVIDADAVGTGGRWLTVAEAARQLACSQRTIWRRIEQHALRRRTRQDRTVEVWVPDSNPDNAVPDGQCHGVDDGVPTLALQITERVTEAVARHTAPLLEQLAAERTRVDALTERVERVARENGQLAERNAALAQQLDTVTGLSERVVTRWRLAAAVTTVVTVLVLVAALVLVL
jgi:hypothetical protein